MDLKNRFINDDFRISQESTGNGWTMPYSHCHVSYEIYILTSGERVVTIEDKEYTVKAHDATLFLSNVPHKSRGNTPFSGICIHFSERYLDLSFTVNTKKNLLRCFKNKVLYLSDDAFHTIQTIADNFIVNSTDNFVILSIILTLLNHSAPGNHDGVTAGQEKGLNKAQLIMQYIEENYVFIKHISDITTTFHVSEAYIFQIYRKNYNVTPKQYINRLRIRHACHRLQHTSHTIKSIALDCGFDSYEYFVNVFKEIARCTPTEYRKQKSGEKDKSMM